MMPVSTLARESRSLRPRKFWPHDLILGFLPLILVLQVAIWSVFLPKGGLRGIADFRQLYTGGYMLRTGHAKELCNYDAQKRFEEALVPINVDFMLPINHLPFEELLFVPLSLFSYRTAYWMFLALNGTLLAVCIRLLRSNVTVLSDRWKWFPALLLAAFYPISRAAVQGQDSIILLTLLAGALWSVDHDRDLTAGLLVGMGVFKFQVVIPIALLFLLWRRWRFCAGFAVSGGAAALMSLWLVGFHGARQYTDTLLGMSVRLSSRADMLHYGTIPTAMFNLRGLASALLGGTLSRFSVLFVIFACSVAVLVVTARQRPSLPLAIIASSLVSYHFLCHDASILIIPLSAALCSRSVWNGAAAALLLIIPIAAVIPQYGYLAVIPLLALFVLSVRSADNRTEACQLWAT